MAPLKVLIIGNSIAGPALASLLLLSSCQPQITLLERSSTLRKEGQNIDVRGAGLTILKHLGINDLVRAHTTGEEGVQLVDAQDRVWATFLADRSENARSTPTADVEILRGTLAEILNRRLRQLSEEMERNGGQGVEFLFGDRLESIEQDGNRARVKFAKSGERRDYDLVVGADGLQSLTRSMVWGAEGETERLHRVAGGVYAAFFSMPSLSGEKRERAMYRRWLHVPGKRSMMVRPSEVPGRETVFMTIINEEDERFETLSSQRGRENVQAQKELMKEIFKDVGWDCSRVLDEMMVTEDFYYDTIAQVKMDKFTKGRVALLGDSGYCACPFSGMGTTLALVGAWNLAGAIVDHPNDHAKAFSEYEEKMRPVIDRAQKLSPGMPKLMHPETAWGVWVLHVFVWFMDCAGLFSLLVSLGAGPPAHFVPVEDYGFRKLSEMRD